MQDLNITLIQQSLHWLDPEANRNHFAKLIQQIEQPTDLVILPEMFTTGFTMDPEPIHESLPGPTQQWMADLAQTTGTSIMGSYAVKDGDNYYNRLLFMQPDGQFDHYDKRHLFRMADEHLRYQGGNSRLVVEYKGWRICPLVCYDLRFPVWSRNRDDYDLLIYVANWPGKRKHHWQALLRARAIENLCYVAGVNRIGKDGNGYEYNGDTVLHDAQGNDLISAQHYAGCFSHTLSGDDLKRYRKEFPAYLDADAFDIK